jgi:hypothetical protein
MLKTILRWLSMILNDPRPAQLSREGRARVARLDEMRADADRLTHEAWWAKWRPGEPVP